MHNIIISDIVLMQDEINGPNCNIGYRQMWRVIQDKYNYVAKRFNIRFLDQYISLKLKIIYRSTVMMLMKILNPTGVENRRRHRLKRRIYQNKVHRVIAYFFHIILCVHYFNHGRALILCGTWMVTIN